MYLKIIKREEYEAKIGRTNWLMSDILYTTNAMQWYKFYRRKYMLTKKKYTTCICICICITQCVSHILKPILIDNGQWQVLEEKKNPGKRFCFHKDRYLAAQSLEVKTNCSFGEPTGINNSHFCQIWKISKNKKNTKSKHKYSLLRNTLFGRCYQVLWNVNIWKQENPAVMFQKGHHMNAHIRITTKIGNTSIADFLLPI